MRSYKFNPLLTVDISHSYYQDRNGCKDFDFLFPADTAQVIRNGKLIARAREGRLFMLFEADENGNPLVSIAKGTSLRIGLKLLNPHFSNFTDLNDFTSSTIPFYSNDEDPRILNKDMVFMVGKLFTHSLHPGSQAVTVTLKDNPDQTPPIEWALDRTSVSCNLTGYPVGLYKVLEEIASTSYYFDPESYRQGIFGVIEINIDDGFYRDPPAFKIEFKSKKQLLKYYLVVRNLHSLDVDQFSVIDAGYAEDEREQIYFTKMSLDELANDKLYPAFNNNDTKVVPFRSIDQIERRQKARRKIQLKKNGDSLIENLPQPGADKANADLIVQLSKFS